MYQNTKIDKNIKEKSPIPFYDKARKKNDELSNAHDCSDFT